MSIINGQKPITKQDLSDFYQGILPYLGGSADAGFTPIGTVIPMIAETAPANYLICDGTAYNKSDYPELAKHLLSMTEHSMYEVSGDSTKFKVPDLRGEFMRMTGTNSHANQGSGAAVGVHQNATQMPTLYIWDNGYQIGSYVGTNATSGTEYFDKAIKQSTKGMSVNCNHSWDTVTTSIGTVRPTNTSFLFCIATKNIYLNPSNDYSTDEKVIGTWIDGKPLYEKTIQLNTLELESSRYHSLTLPGVTNLDKIIDFKCIGFASIGSEITIPFRSLNVSGELDNNYLGLSFANGYFDLRSQTDRSTMTFYCTFQYTKTTD